MPYPTKRELPSPLRWPATDASLQQPTVAQQQPQKKFDPKREKRSSHEMSDQRGSRTPDVGESSKSGKSKNSCTKSNLGVGVKNSSKADRQRSSASSATSTIDNGGSRGGGGGKLENGRREKQATSSGSDAGGSGGSGVGSCRGESRDELIVIKVGKSESYR